MYTIYLKENLKLITGLSDLNAPENAEYKKDIYVYIEVEDTVGMDFCNKKFQGKEIIVKDGKLQEMVYANEIVKFLKDFEDFKKDTYAKINNYDFRLEGIDYVKTARDDPDYLAYLQELEFQKAKKEKIEEAGRIFDKIVIEIIDIENSNVIDIYSPSKDIVAVFEEGIDFEETPFEFFKISNEDESVFLPNSSLQTLLIETRDVLQYQATNFLRNKREIGKLTTIESIENYVIKTGKNLDGKVIDKLKVVVKIFNNELLISQIKTIDTQGLETLKKTIKN